MKQKLLTAIAAVLFFSAFFSGKTKAAGDGIDVFDLSKPLVLSWNVPENLAIDAAKRNVQIMTSDPWNHVDFETSFKLAEKGEIDNLVAMSGTTGIPLLIGHSGYFHGYPQTLEWIRAYIQGGRANAEKTKMILYDSGTEKRHIANLKGVKMTLTQESMTRTWSIAFIVKVPHKNVPSFSASADDAVVTTTQSMDKEEMQEFLKRTGDGEKPLFVATCFWGSEIKNGWGTFGRYVFIMFPDMPPDVK